VGAADGMIRVVVARVLSGECECECEFECECHSMWAGLVGDCKKVGVTLTGQSDRWMGWRRACWMGMHERE